MKFKENSIYKCRMKLQYNSRASVTRSQQHLLPKIGEARLFESNEG